MIKITGRVLNTSLLEVADKFVVVYDEPYSSPPKPNAICTYVVQKVGARDVVCKGTRGNELRLKLKSSKSGVYHVNDPALIPIRESIQLSSRQNRAQKVLSEHPMSTWDDGLIEAVMAFERRVQGVSGVLSDE